VRKTHQVGSILAVDVRRVFSWGGGGSNLFNKSFLSADLTVKTMLLIDFGDQIMAVPKTGLLMQGWPSG
jgi:hypothetical protein